MQAETMAADAHAVEFRGITKRFGKATAVHRLDLAIEEGSFTTLLGPSGCGKTTTLRMLAGLVEPSEGEIFIRGSNVTGTPIHKRNLGLVFQNYALFPHKSVFDNVAFGLRYRNVETGEISRRVHQALSLVQLPDAGKRFPRELSGGQQQRIALARALVIEPDVLLLDEPLSALDANLREDMRVELKAIQKRLGLTTIFVTHDQGEALAMSDRIVLLRDGRIEQSGAPADVYDNPASLFVAQFLGASNALPATVSACSGKLVTVEAPGLGTIAVDNARAANVRAGEQVQLMIRAEKVFLDGADAAAPGDVNRLSGTIETVDYQGQTVRYFVRAGGHQLQAINTIDEAPFRQGASVSIRIQPRHCRLLRETTGQTP